jgi:hypothetical protein
MMKFRGWVVIATVLLLAGCDQQALMDRMVPKEDVTYAESLIARFPAHDYDGIIAELDPGVVRENTRAKLTEMAALFPAETPLSTHVVGWSRTMTNDDPAVTRITLEYQYSRTWLLAQLVLKKQGTNTIVDSVYVQPIRDSLEHVNRFTFEGRSAKYYAFFALTIAVPLFVLYALIACIRTPMPRRKWLWVLFMLVGVVRLNLDWTTGAVSLMPLYFLLLGSAAFKSGVAGAWVLSTSLPLGAILFMLRRRRWLEKAEATEDDEEDDA